MMHTSYRFQSYPYSVTATFDCPRCGKAKRKRTFKAECTVNPFNTGEDGNVLSAGEVRLQSQRRALSERDMFMKAPMCASCENGLTFEERKSLLMKRRDPVDDGDDSSHD